MSLCVFRLPFGIPNRISNTHFSLLLKRLICLFNRSCSHCVSTASATTSGAVPKTSINVISFPLLYYLFNINFSAVLILIINFEPLLHKNKEPITFFTAIGSLFLCYLQHLLNKLDSDLF